MTLCYSDQSFLKNLRAGQLSELFSLIPDIQFFMKDKEGRFVLVDQGFIEMLGTKDGNEVLGKTDFDFFPETIATCFVEDDKLVMESQKPLPNRMELVPNNELQLDWCLANKIPLFGLNGEVVGIAGISRKMAASDIQVSTDSNLNTVVEYIRMNFAKQINVEQLAEIAGLTVRTLNRRFTKAFDTSPLRYIKTVRLNSACYALTNTSRTISEIAFDCGFCDQSYMTKEFSARLGVTPREYRLKYSKKA
ncbi:MAG: AraC family transcriptional regulator [Verrucomicrobiota bacterium]